MKTDRGNHPIVLWPVLIHQTKIFHPFHYFASTLIRLNPQLSKLRAFGTDGEFQLIRAFSVTFPKAVHLRCMNHIRQNVKDKLRALGIPQTAWKEFLADVFGVQKGSHFEMGLVDAHSGDSFWEALHSLEERWNNLEKGCSPPGANPQFYRWFCAHKAKDIVECALPEIRSKAGLDPSHHFTTNNSESLNHVIKQEVDWKESKLPVLVEHLRSVVKRHNAELEKAVIRIGEWQFTTQYQQLEVPESTWFEMPPECQEKHMKKVLTFSIVPSKLFSVASTSSCIVPQPSKSGNQCTKSSTAFLESIHPDTLVPCRSAENGSQHVLDVAVEDCGITQIPFPTLNNMWNKAERLVQADGAILKVPWSPDAKARLVMSSSSEHPHLVKAQGDKYSCDDKCIMFKGFSLCSHVIAAAQHNGDLQSFLESQQGRCQPNLTAIGNLGMPAGAG